MISHTNFGYAILVNLSQFKEVNIMAFEVRIMSNTKNGP